MKLTIFTTPLLEVKFLLPRLFSNLKAINMNHIISFVKSYNLDTISNQNATEIFNTFYMKIMNSPFAFIVFTVKKQTKILIFIKWFLVDIPI